MPARFIRNCLLGALFLLAIAGGINYAVDPFQQYRIPSFYEPRFYRAYQRHVPALLPALWPRSRRSTPSQGENTA